MYRYPRYRSAIGKTEWKIFIFRMKTAHCLQNEILSFNIILSFAHHNLFTLLQCWNLKLCDRKQVCYYNIY